MNILNNKIYIILIVLTCVFYTNCKYKSNETKYALEDKYEKIKNDSLDENNSPKQTKEENSSLYNKVTKNYSDVDSIRKNEVSSGRVNNKIFLGFSLGMSKEEYENHYLNYKNKGVFSKMLPVTNVDSIDTYQLLDQLYSIFPGFYNNKLVSISLEQVNENKNNTYEIVDIYQKKYGNYTISFQGEGYVWQSSKFRIGTNTFFINGNREIEIGTYFIKYTDLNFYFQNQKKEEQKLKNNRAENMKNI